MTAFSGVFSFPKDSVPDLVLASVFYGGEMFSVAFIGESLIYFFGDYISSFLVTIALALSNLAFIAANFNSSLFLLASSSAALVAFESANLAFKSYTFEVDLPTGTGILDLISGVFDSVFFDNTDPFIPPPIGFIPTPTGFIPEPPGLIPAPPGLVPAPPGLIPAPPGLIPPPMALAVTGFFMANLLGLSPPIFNPFMLFIDNFHRDRE